MLTKNKADNKIVIDFISKLNDNREYNVNIIFCDTHIIEEKIKHIKKTDILFWQPLLAHNNIELMKEYANSIVVLEKPTVYIQKISKLNPINESLAVNNGFYITYLSPDVIDITNNDWKLVVKDDMFLLDIRRLKILMNKQQENINGIIIESEDIFEDITNLTKEQINF